MPISNPIERDDIRSKTDALKKLIQAILNGEKQSPPMLMTVIRFVMPVQDHTIKKLLLIFWEVVPKYTPDGKMMQEMILVCDAYRKVCLIVPLPHHLPYSSRQFCVNDSSLRLNFP